jgi:hypothetical protein
MERYSLPRHVVVFVGDGVGIVASKLSILELRIASHCICVSTGML